MENICKEIHIEVDTCDFIFSKSVRHPRIPLENYVIGSNDLAVKYLEYICAEVLKLKVNPNLSSLKKKLYPQKQF